MILPFMSFTWSQYAGKFGMPMVRMFSDVPNAARSAAIQLNARAKGRRVILFQNVERNGKLFSHPNDRLNGKYTGLWWTNGIAATKADFTVVVEQLFANKGDLDLALFDMEGAVSPFVLNENDFAAIYADPRYKALVATGRFPADCRTMNSAELMLFNSGCQYIAAQAFYTAIIAVLYKRYNNLQWCNYGDYPVNKADAAFAPDLNGHAAYYTASSAPIYSPVIYGYVNQLAAQDGLFKEPFTVVVWHANTLRMPYRAKASAKLMPWVAPKRLSNVLDTTWWVEQLFHCCCLCGPNLLYFNADDHTAITNWRFDNAIAQFVGQARGQKWLNVVTTDIVRYDTAKYVYSACRLADKSVVGRVTFKPGTDSATFAVAGKTYTVKRPDGQVGAWFHS